MDVLPLMGVSGLRYYNRIGTDISD